MTKESTRHRLQREALRLFVEQGYDQTTVADIAAAAGLTPMTFFRYFGSKERVVVEDPYDPAIAAAITEQPRDQPALDRVRCGLLSAWEGIEDTEDSDLRLRLSIGASHPGLRARMRENSAATEAAIVGALTAQGVPRFEATVAAAAAIGALTAALLEWATDPNTRSIGEAVRSALQILGPSGSQ